MQQSLLSFIFACWLVASTVANASVVTCNTSKSDVAVTSAPLSYVNPFITTEFGRILAFYEENSTHQIFVKAQSKRNDTFTVEPEFPVGVGQLLAASQSVSQGVALFRVSNGDILSRTFTLSTSQMSASSPLAFIKNDSNTAVGIFFTSSIGFVAWSTSATKGVLRAIRQGPNFEDSPNWEPLGVNLTANSYALAGAMDSDNTIMFIVDRAGSVVCGIIPTSGSSFFNQPSFRVIGPVPTLAEATVITMASPGARTFLAVSVVSRDGRLAMQTVYTANNGATWEPSFEVGAFDENPFANVPVSLIWTDRWTVLLNTQEGHKVFQMTEFLPFEFDWRKGLADSTIVNLNDANLHRRSLTYVIRGNRILALGTEGDNAISKISAVYCVRTSDSNRLSHNVGVGLGLAAFLLVLISS